MKPLLMLLSLLLPWSVRRQFLEKQFGYSLHPSSRIGLAWVFPERLVMEANSSIGDLTVCKQIALLHLHENANIGRGNWITGFPLGPSQHFAGETDRRPELIVGAHSAITHRHLIDCTNSITIGKFTTFAGFQSQMLTHSIDIQQNRQASAPIRIGDYCFVGTNSVLLGGSALPDFCVLGAKSLLNKSFAQTHRLYGGVPARELQELSPDYAYFRRSIGFVT
ncbi:MAG: acyltransferase [Chthoniobacterales bacterium]|nr:acyltransferase [Chthoniobacterales bacterium]